MTISDLYVRVSQGGDPTLGTLASLCRLSSARAMSALFLRPRIIILTGLGSARPCLNAVKYEALYLVVKMLLMSASSTIRESSYT